MYIYTYTHHWYSISVLVYRDYDICRRYQWYADTDTNIHTYMHTYIMIHTYIHWYAASPRNFTFNFLHIHMHTYTHTYVHTCRHNINMHLRNFAGSSLISACWHTYIHTLAYTHANRHGRTMRHREHHVLGLLKILYLISTIVHWHTHAYMHAYMHGRTMRHQEQQVLRLLTNFVFIFNNCTLTHTCIHACIQAWQNYAATRAACTLKIL